MINWGRSLKLTGMMSGEFPLSKMLLNPTLRLAQQLGAGHHHHRASEVA
jgi:hypothetical protein